MTSSFLLADLQQDEGFRAKAYPDPLSHADPWTIGYGHTGPDVKQGDVVTVAQALDLLGRDVGKAQAGLTKALPWFTGLSDIRQDCLVNMAFNMGVGGLLGFHTFLHLVQTGQYAQAADDLHGTLWAKQVGGRAVRIATRMETGNH